MNRALVVGGLAAVLVGGFGIGWAVRGPGKCAPCPAVQAKADCATRYHEWVSAREVTQQQAIAECAPTAAARVRYIPAPPGPGCPACPGLEVDVSAGGTVKADCKEVNTQTTDGGRALEGNAGAVAKVEPTPPPAAPGLRLTTDLLGGVRMNDHRALVGAAAALQFPQFRAGAWLMTDPAAPVKGAAVGGSVGWRW